MKNTPDHHAISCSNITKEFILEGRRLRVLDGISFDVPEGEFLSIMGPSGSGKTTLLNIIGAMDVPSSGKLEIDGKDVSSIPESRMHDIRRNKVSHVFQQFHLVNGLTALENLLIPLIPTGIPRLKAIDRAKEKLSLVGMSDRANHRPSQLSGGQQQRIAIARSLMNDAGIMLADEPTGNLDSRTGREIIGLLHELNRSGMTVIMVTHNPDLARTTDRILHIKDGRVGAEEMTWS